MDGSFQPSLVGTLQILRQTRRYAGVFDNTLGQFASKKKLQPSAGGAGARGVINAWRIAQGSQSAVFKKIAKGGAHTAKQLRAQVDYLFSKATSVFGNMVDQGTGEDEFLPEARAAMVEQWSANWRHAPARGQTSHLLLSFPADVSAQAALNIARTWTAEMFQSRVFCDDEWAFVAALHTDRPHPHVHIVLNNRGLEKDTWFYMAKTHVFEANAMRERLVEISREFGVFLDSSSRLERGIISYGMSRVEREIAAREGVVPVARKRHGPALETALHQIEQNRKAVQLLADMAALAGDDKLGGNLHAMERTLAAGQNVQQGIGNTMDDRQTGLPPDFQAYVGDWNVKAEARVAGLSTDQQAEQRQEFARVRQALATALGDTQNTVPREQTPTSHLYSTRIEGDRIMGIGQNTTSETPISSETSRKLMARLKFLGGEVGIEATDISDRLRQGAANAQQEQRWIERDLQAVAGINGFELDSEDHTQAARELLNTFYTKAATLIAETRAQGVQTDHRRLLRTLHKVAATAEEHGAVEFASARDVEGFVEDIQERYGPDIASRLAAGDRSPLQEDFPDAEVSRDIAIGILTVAKDHAFGGITRSRAINAIVDLKLEHTQDDTFEQGFDDAFDL